MMPKNSIVYKPAQLDITIIDDITHILTKDIGHHARHPRLHEPFGLFCSALGLAPKSACVYACTRLANFRTK